MGDGEGGCEDEEVECDPYEEYCEGEPGLILESGPVPVNLLAKRTRLMLHAGQHGILCLGLAASLPQVSLPQQLEHLYHGRRAADAGVARVVEGRIDGAERVRTAVLEAYDDSRMRDRARAVAAEIRPTLRDVRGAIRDHLLPLVA